MPKKSKKPSSVTDYEQLGRAIAAIYETNYANRSRVYKMSFVKGIVAGLGGVIGATIVAALLLWVLNFFDQVPLVGPLTNKIQDTVQTKPGE